MSDPFLAEIRVFPFTFSPLGWAFCGGQQMPIAQNGQLYNVIGVTYGGNGTTTFNLPNLAASVAMGSGTGPGLSPRIAGQSGGSATETLIASEMPAHGHPLAAQLAVANVQEPSPQTVLARAEGGYVYQSSTANLQPLAAQPLPPVGGNMPHNNMMPSVVLNFCIALQGAVPSHG